MKHERRAAEGKDSSFLDDVETKCPCKCLFQTHCSPRSQSKQACQTQLESHYRRTMAPCEWGPIKTFPRFSLVGPSLYWQGISLQTCFIFIPQFHSYHFLLSFLSPFFNPCHLKLIFMASVCLYTSPLLTLFY